jgi:ATP-dependent DNA ligase
MGGQRKDPGLGRLWTWPNFTAELAAEIRHHVPDVYAVRSAAVVSWEFRRRRAIIDARFTPWVFEMLDETGKRVDAFDITRSDGHALQIVTSAIVAHIDVRRPQRTSQINISRLNVIRKQPMLLHEADRPFDREGQDSEIKFDGFRVIVYGEERALISRNAKNLTQRFKDLHEVADRFGDHRAIVDGEAVAFVDDVPSFRALQRRSAPVTFVAFDILQLDGESTIDLTLAERRILLARIIPEDVPHLMRSRAFSSPTALYEQAVLRNLEGIVIKDTRSRYIYGPTRTRNWIKVKTPFGRAEDKRRQESWGHD